MIVVWQDTRTCTVRANNDQFTKKLHDDSYHVVYYDDLVYLVYSCTEDKIAFFIPLKGKDWTFVLAKCTGQVSCGGKHTDREQGL